jgi:hypothetical protein
MPVDRPRRGARVDVSPVALRPAVSWIQRSPNVDVVRQCRPGCAVREDARPMLQRSCHATITPRALTPRRHVTTGAVGEVITMRKELTLTELDSQHADLLPARETLAFNNNWANVIASNSSLALNAASVYATANSAAVQQIAVSQG